MGEVWERLPGEPSRAYAAFCLYRDMGLSRTLDKVAAQFHPGSGRRKRAATGRIQEWSRKWRWVERAQAWDDEVDRRKREAQLKAIEEMNDRQAREATILQQKALERLKDLMPEELTPGQALDYIIEAARLERTARGMPESETRVRVRHEDNDKENFLEDLFKRHPELIEELFGNSAGSEGDSGSSTS